MADGQPLVTPTLQWREGDRIYWHGSAASRMIKAVEGAEVCLTVSAIDGLVMARSAFNFNVNHRSVMVFGRPSRVTDPAAKEAHLRTMVNRLIPGQWERLRPMKPNELEATTVMSMPFDEASAKVRVGPPEDEPGRLRLSGVGRRHPHPPAGAAAGARPAQPARRRTAGGGAGVPAVSRPPVIGTAQDRGAPRSGAA